MRKQTHFRKVVSLALAAAMAVSVCTTALADDDVVVDATAQPEVSETVDTQDKSAEEEKKSEDTDADIEQSEEQASEEESPAEENTPATQNGQPENGLAVQTTEGNEAAEEVGALQKQINDALANADTATITLQENCTLSQSLKIPADKSVTLDLNGKTVTDNSEEGPWTEGVLTIKDSMGGAVYDLKGSNASINVKGANAKFILESGKITSLVDGAYGVYCSQGGTAIVNGGEIVSKMAPLTGNNTTGNMNFEVNGGTLTAQQGPAIYMPGQVSLKITGGTLNGGVSLRMGQVTISGGTINAMTDVDSIDMPNGNVGSEPAYTYSGNVWFPDALYVIGGTYTSEDTTYGNSLDLNITGGTFNCANGKGSGVAIYDLGKVGQTMKVNVSGDAQFATNAADRKAYQVVSLSDIGVTTPEEGFGVYSGSVNSKLTGGTYSNEPKADCIAEDYEAVQDGSVWKVQKMAAVAQIGNTTYTSLAKAVAAANSGDTITLLTDRTESVTIPAEKNITLNLNGCTLTNEDGKHTIENNGTLTVIGNGTVDNVSHGKGALMNNPGARATLNGGIFTRSKEAGKDANNSGKNSWYTICNHGTMTFNDGVTVNQGADGNGKYSSLIENGWQNGGDNTTKVLSIMTINGGTFSGGLNTLKNDDYGDLTITGGTIKGFAQAALLNWNVAKIIGGTLDGTNAKLAVILNGNCDATIDKGELTISGGTFITSGKFIEIMDSDYGFGTVKITDGKFQGKIGATNGAKYNNSLTITGGYYTNKVDDKYIGNGTDGNKLSCNLLETKFEGIYNYTIGKAPAVKTDVIVAAPEVKAMEEKPALDGKSEDEAKKAVEDAAKNIEIAADSVGDVEQKVFSEAKVDNKALNAPETAAAAKKALEDKKIDTAGTVQDPVTVTVVATPKLNITPKTAVSETNGTKEISFDIKLTYDILATTAKNPTEKNMVTEEDVKQDPTKKQNTVKLNDKPIEVENPPVMDITLDVSVIGFTRADEANLYVKHTKDADEGSAVYYYGKENGKIKDIQYATDNNTIESLTFINEHGFSEFATVTDKRTATIKFDKPANAADASKDYRPGNVGDALPAAEARSGYRFIGWRINGDVYTTLANNLLSTLNGSTVDAFAVYELIPTDAASSDNSTSAPEATAAPSVGGSEVYYTCVACGHHDWTATAEGYKCNYCGHLESVKQLSGYANVKGTYEPKTSTAKAAAAKSAVKSSSAIPQTSDDMPIVPIAVIAIAALLGLGVTVVLKRKHN